MKLRCVAAGVAMLGLVVVMPGNPADAHAPSGAIFTTLSDGSEVNFNIYASKDLVYLDGGPGPGAPQGAAGLDDAEYYFQVTDPSGKHLLSQDPIECRRIRISGGVISAVVGSCVHATGTDVDHSALTVQLMPYADTPNNGNEYKVWVTFASELNCNAPGNKHCFVPAHSKTDNFKVGGVIREIDVKFFHDDGNGIQDWYEPQESGFQTTWIDTLGASNKKWSLYNPDLYVWNYAHIEAIEAGVHKIVVNDQPGCRVGQVRTDYGPDDPDPGTHIGTGAGAYPIKISNWGKDWGVYVEVACL